MAGTEEELRRAIDAARDVAVQDILVFGDSTPFELPTDVERDERHQSFEQCDLVEKFVEACRKAGMKEVVNGYNQHAGLIDSRDSLMLRLKARPYIELQRRDASNAG